MKHLIILLTVFFSLSIPAFNQANHDFEIAKNMDIYLSVAKQLNTHYVDDIQIGSLNEKAIVAMLKSLDPYTVYYPESKIEDVEYMRTGEYGGIGASIHIQKDTVVVGSVLKDYPFDKSGIQAGDKLLAIDDINVVGKSTSEMSDILKGSAGSTLSIRFWSYKNNEILTKTITREKIKINAVSHFELLENNIAYVKLSQFNQTAASEVRNALDSLGKSSSLKGVIIDLRDNGGGLLMEAVKIMDMFLPSGELVVETRGKLKSESIKYKTKNAALYPDLPVTILVNKRSASASEIVAGAFQDTDRGVIIGQKSFGKGLVQKVYPLSYRSQMKITIAKYYIPSGRCIQAIDYSDANDPNHHKIADSLRAVFKTKNGRKVLDAGGIRPDVAMAEKKYGDYSTQLAQKHQIFNYASWYVKQHSAPKNVDAIQLTDEDFNNFKAFLHSQNFSFQSQFERNLKALWKNHDTMNSQVQESYRQLLQSIHNYDNMELDKEKAEILELLQYELASRYFYTTGKIQMILKDDLELQKALNLIMHPKEYNHLLNN